VGPENQALLKFFHQTYQKIGGKKRILEIGGGPTIYQLISASAKGNTIVFSDYLDRNLREVKKWLNNNPGAYNWDKYFDYVLGLEGKRKSHKNRQDLKNRVRKSVQELIIGDIRKDNPLSPRAYPPFDVASVTSVPEAITNQEKEFTQYMENITSLLKSGGWLVQFVCKNMRQWKVGNVYFVGFPVDETYMETCLRKLGFEQIGISTIPNEHDQGYEGLILITARKKN